MMSTLRVQHEFAVLILQGLPEIGQLHDVSLLLGRFGKLADPVLALPSPQLRYAGVFFSLPLSPYHDRPLFLPGSMCIQSTAPISPGSSGGPLLSQTGKVVGVNFAKMSSASDAENVNFAIPAWRVAQLVARHQFDASRAKTQKTDSGSVSDYGSTPTS